MIQKLLRDKDRVILADGAMGTYFTRITGSMGLPEWANIHDPDRIRSIHRQYIEAGSELIRTNTFSANTWALGCSHTELKDIVTRGYRLAQEAAQEKAIAAANMGPMPEFTRDNREVEAERIVDEYRLIVDTFLQQGADVFVFETLGRLEPLVEVFAYIRAKHPTSFILAQFAVTREGYTRKGIAIKRLLNQALGSGLLDACGFNCSMGPAHLVRLISQLQLTDVVLSAMPNAGYPEVVNERTVYHQNPSYFADVCADLPGEGIRIIGGCCGTTPEHIQALAQKLRQDNVHRPAEARPRSFQPDRKRPDAPSNAFAAKLDAGLRQFPVAVELDPPFRSDVADVMQSARMLQAAGADIITLADSPLARPRMDSLVLAAKIRREVGIETMPHICCRDRNIISLKGGLTAAHVEGIRNLLAVTGDPIPSAEREAITGVFNLNSIMLMELISEMNEDDFADDPYYLGGALNLKHLNTEKGLRRMARKIEHGARFFLTQPVFDRQAAANLAEARNRFGVKILGGLMPLVSLRNAQFLNNEVPGIDVPEQHIRRFSMDMSKQQAADIGIEIAVQLAHSLRDFVDGYYIITPFNRAELVVQILDRLATPAM